MLESQKLVGSGPVQPVRWLRLCTCYTTGSLKTTLLDVRTPANHHPWFYPDIFSKIMLGYFLYSHLADLSFTQGIFPSKFKLAQISPLLKKPPGALQIWSFKFQAYFQFEHYWQNIGTLGFGSPPSSSFYFSQFFTPSVGISKVPFYRNSFAQTWLMISRTPLIQERSQFSLLSICRLLLTLWTILPFFIGLNIHLVCQELSTPGFTHT